MNVRSGMLAGVVFVMTVGTARGQMVIDGLSGAVTASEVASFKTYVTGLPLYSGAPVPALAYGTQARIIEGTGLMYEMTRDPALLDTMIRWCDRTLSMRNDPVSGTLDWTGRRELIWQPELVKTGAEEGLIIAKIAYCAQLILETPGVWGTTVPDGNPHGYGATYRQRADRYVADMDETEETYMIRYYVRASDNRYYFPDQASGYDGTTWYGEPFPFNQQWMMNMAKMRLARCYQILGNTTKASQYRAIVQESLSWYTSDFTAVTAAGQPCYSWRYSPSRTYIEDGGHAQWGVLGMFYLDLLGGYSDYPDRARIANTLRYVMYRDQADSDYWTHKVDGTGDLQNYLQPQFVFLARQGESWIYTTGSSDLMGDNHVRNSPDDVAYILWSKQARHTGNWTTTSWPGSTPTPTPGPTPSPTPTPTPGGGGFSGYYRIIARHSGKAVVVQGASTANAGDVIQWTYGGASTNDEWQLVDLGTGYYRITNRHSGKVLNVSGSSTTNGANVDQWSWANVNQQQWQVTSLGNGYHRLTARHSGKVLNVAGVSTADGANVDQYAWANVNQQQFQLISVP